MLIILAFYFRGGVCFADSFKAIPLFLVDPLPPPHYFTI
jgi:hypothetical protein